MANSILPVNAVPVWVFAASPDGTLSPATIGGGGGAVSSVFGRTGAVVAATNDYAVAQVTGAAPLASPTFTGVPAAPTATPGTNTTQLATTAFVTAAVSTGDAFSAITSGTNTTAAMVVGAGGSLNFTSTGTINASTLGGATFAAPGPVGSTTASTAAFTTLSATGVVTLSQAGALSASAINITGAPITGGSGTTTFPLIYVNSGAAPTTFSANGTLLGLNSPSGFTGNFLDVHLNGGASLFSVTSTGVVICTGSMQPAAGIVSGGSITMTAAGNLGWTGRSTLRSSANGKANFNNNANTSGGMVLFTFGTEAVNNPAFSFDGTTATITACDGAGTAANGIFNCALYKSGGTSGVSAGPLAPASIQTVGGIVTVLTAVSDERLKNYEAYTTGLNAIEAIQPVRYKWNEKGKTHTQITNDQVFVGFVAQNVQSVIPEAITGTEGEEKYLSFDDRPVIAALVNAVKELSAKVTALEAR